MAALSRAQKRQIRAWVGATDPTDEELQERFDDLGGEVLEVALQVLQERLGGLTSGPESWNAAGDYSEDNSDVIATLRSQVADLAQLLFGHPLPGFEIDADDRATTPSLFRDDRERLFLPRP